MNIELTTTQLDPSIAMNALNEYRAKRYRTALTQLVEILDFEPQNWQARLFLGVCYVKTNQLAAAHRAFDAVHKSCGDADLKARAYNALEVVTQEFNRLKQVFAHEFGLDQARLVVARVAVIESIVG